jgi:hypothetical protein
MTFTQKFAAKDSLIIVPRRTKNKKEKVVLASPASSFQLQASLFDEAIQLEVVQDCDGGENLLL